MNFPEYSIKLRDVIIVRVMAVIYPMITPKMIKEKVSFILSERDRYHVMGCNLLIIHPFYGYIISGQTVLNIILEIIVHYSYLSTEQSNNIALRMNTMMISREEAYSTIFSQVQPAGSEKVDLFQAGKRFLSEDIISAISIPPTDNSAMDGFAFSSKTTVDAAPENLVKLSIVREVAAGDSYKGEVKENETVRIMTGAPMPRGCDTVLEVEKSREEKSNLVLDAPYPENVHVRKAGEDIKTGDVVFKKGTFLTSGRVGILASMGITEVPVFKKPKVAIFSTGNELAEPGTEKEDHHIYNSNAYALYSETLNSFCEPYYMGIIPDKRDKTEEMLKEAFNYDIVVTSGGVSLGNYDFVSDSLKSLGVDVHFTMVKIKPGKPMTFGSRDGKLFFSLPGNPVSSLINFIEFVKPAVYKMLGAVQEKKHLQAVLDTSLKKKAGRYHYQRGILSIQNGEIHVSTTGDQGSGILRSMSDADCLILLPEEISDPQAGEKVTVELLG
jgi:molybdopterin molybdotransferase